MPTSESAAPDTGWLERSFEEHRPRLRSVAFRMLGSQADADDAVQDAWLRVSRADTAAVENLGGWLTTIVARVCLNQLRSRRRYEDTLVRIPAPVISADSGQDPEEATMLSDGVALALLVVLESLTPAERLAFVLHDMFAVPYAEIAEMLGSTAAATRQLASRARRRVRGAAPTPDPDVHRQREAVNAFFAASRNGDFDALLSILHPDVVLRADGGTKRPQLTMRLRGARNVASKAAMGVRLAPFTYRVLVNGAPGLIVAPQKRVQVVMAFTVVDGRIVAIDSLADPERLAHIDVGEILGPHS